MGLRTILFLLAFATATLGSLFNPLLGVFGYVLHYDLGPERQWWAAPIGYLGIRYSLTLAVATAIGMAIHWRRLQYGEKALLLHEKLMLLFLAVVWFSTLVGGETVGRYTMTDHPSVKMTKVIIFTLMLTHVVTTTKRIDLLLWAMVAGALLLGMEAYTTPRSHFRGGRLEGVGGPDFAEANFLGAYLAAMVPLIGIQFLRSGWIGKGVCLVSGVLAVNTIVLTRSRGAVVGLAGGALLAMFLAPKRWRLPILAGIIVAGIGAYQLMDPQFIDRSSTILRPEEERDRSSESRLEIWQGAGRMLMDHPLGVGAGNFYQNIGRYSPNNPGRDAHNTFVRCFGELGFPGIAVFLLLLGNVGHIVWRTLKRARDSEAREGQQLALIAYGFALSLAVFLTCGLTGTFLYTEGTWWLLAAPVCMTRALENLQRDTATMPLADRRQASGTVHPANHRPAPQLESGPKPRRRP